MGNRMIVDLHCDTLCSLLDNNLALDNDVTMINRNTLTEGNVFLQDFACFALYNKNPYQRVKNLIGQYHKMLSLNKDIIPVLSSKDLDGKNIHSILSIEEGGALEGKIERLYEFYQDGVRLITLTWNFKNEIGSPNNVRENIPNTVDGLTDFGVSLVEEMNKLGVIIDISHLGDKSVLEVFKLTKKPIVASHSGARAICNHVRNLPDELIKLMIQNNGFIGINFCKAFLNDHEEFAGIDDVINHIDYIKSLGGIDVIGFGSDFDGISNKDIEIKNPSFFSKIIERLKEKGYTDLEIDKISHLNALRVIKANLE